MLKMKKSVPAMALAAVLCVSQSPVAFAATPSATIESNGATVSSSAGPAVILDGYVYLPLDTAKSAFGAKLTDDVLQSLQVEQNGEAYLPVRKAAEQLGIQIAWDGRTRTVGLLDKDALIASYSDSFTIMDKYLAYSKQFAEETYQVKGTFNFSFSINDNGEMVPFSASGTLDGLTDAYAADMDVALKLNTDQIKELIKRDGGEVTAEDQKLLDMVSNLTVSVIFDMKSGKYYLQSPLFTEAFGGSENTWFEVDLNELLSSAGLNISIGDLVSQIYSTTSYLEVVKQSLSMLPSKTPQEMKVLREYLDMMVGMYGDNAFQKDANGYTATYEESADGVSMAFTMKFSTDANDTVNGYSMLIDVSMLGIKMMDMTMSVTPDLTMTADITFNVPDLMEMKMDMNGSYTKTDAAVKTAPDAGSNITPMF